MVKTDKNIFNKPIKSNFIKKSKTPVFLLIAFLSIFLIGYWIGQQTIACKVCPPEKIDFSLFWETWNKLSSYYVDSSGLDEQKMIYGAISGMVKSLGDPYTSFFPPDETKKFLEDVNGSFEGVGMEISNKKGQLEIVAPIDGTPAQQAGLRAGDKIIKIDDKSTVDMSTEEAVSLIRGPKDSEVVLTIFRNGWDNTKEFKIKRAVIEVPSLSLEIMNDGKEDIAYVKLYNFNENADRDFTKAVADILNSPAKKIILDLRNNPGGYLEVAQRIASWFVDPGQTIVIEDFGGKKPEQVFKAVGTPRLGSYPLVVLINEGSASASEILAAALKENRDATLVGKTSFGKGVVQELLSLSDNSSLKVTVAKWLTPNRNLINEKGIEPDVKVDITDEEYQNGKDPQMDKALEIIKEME
jgi:carboxyl-terminal processing protease